MISDGLGFRRINNLETCVNSETLALSGSYEWAPYATVCAQQTSKLCSCISSVDQSVCHDFDINKYRGQNCNLILNKYTDLLIVSTALDAFNLACVLLLTICSAASFFAMNSSTSAVLYQQQQEQEQELPPVPPSRAAKETVAEAAMREFYELDENWYHPQEFEKGIVSDDGSEYFNCCGNKKNVGGRGCTKKLYSQA
jgi:hypothetical protein